MKLWLLFGLCAVAAASPRLRSNAPQSNEVLEVDEFDTDVEKRSIIINSLTRQVWNESENRNIILNVIIRQLFEQIRTLIREGSPDNGLAPMDPLVIDELHLLLPIGIVNLDLYLKNARMTGLGDFVLHRSNLRTSDLTFDIDISFPRFHIIAEQYDFQGDLFSAIPLYGKGGVEFLIENFRYRALVHLKQSEDGESILLERFENPSYEVPFFKSNLDGVIGGGNIDTIVNAVFEDVLIGYINRFQGAIAQLVSGLVVTHGNPILDQLDTWRIIRPFV